MFKTTVLDIPSTPEEADNFCREKGLLARQMHCPTHRNLPMKLYFDRTHGRFRCNKSKCNKSISGAKGSFFEDMRLESHVALAVMWCFSWYESYEKTEAIVSSLRRKSGSPDETLSPATTATWFRYCREMVTDHFSNMVASLPQIGGPGLIVQIDESLFGQRKYERGRIRQGSWVLGMIDQNENVRMVVVEQRDTETLHREILKYVAPGSVIQTDSWHAYNGLENLPVTPPYVHKTVNNNDPEHRFVAADGTHTQNIKAAWRPAKEFFQGRSRFCDDHFADRLCEYLWRRHCRKNGIDGFEAVLDAVRAQYPLETEEPLPH